MDREDNGAQKLNAQAIGGATKINDAQLGALNFDDGLTMKLQLAVSCSDLPNMDQRSKTDPYCVLWELKGSEKQKIGRTECILDNLNPEFVTNIEVDYHFETNQNFLVEVFDADDMDQLDNLQKQQLVGSANLTLHQLINSPYQKATFQLSNPRNVGNNGQIKIQAEEKRADFGQTECQFDVQISQPEAHINDTLFFILFSTTTDGGCKPVYKSENQKCQSGIFKFGRVFSNTDVLANGINDNEIFFKFYKYDNSGQGSHQVIFQQATKLETLTMSAAEQTETQLQDQNTFGNFTVTLGKIVIQKHVTFLDYIFGGCEISLQVAIDFTASNGDVSDSRSLHYQHGSEPNQYMKAIMAVGSILEQYDTDKQYPVYGFGGHLAESNSTSHCFALNGDIFKPDVTGVQGILKAYQNAIQQTPLSGPTHFSPILEYVSGYCQQKRKEMSQYNQQYTILLILTDGAIWDMQESIDAIVAASDLPLSIIIVGVGQANFSSMKHLDADEAPLYSTKHKQYQARDTVQFVPFHEYAKDPEALSREVLCELPDQLVHYFQGQNIKPNIPEGNNVMLNKIGASLFNQVKAVDSYFDIQREKIIGEGVKYGMDLEQISAFLDVVGIAENNITTLARNCKKNKYVNQLKLDL